MVVLHEVIENIEKLSLEDKEYIAELLKKMVIEAHRREFDESINTGRDEYKNGILKFGTADEAYTSLMHD